MIYYTRVLNVCEYIQTYSLACPWLLSWPDSSLGDEHRGDNLRVDVCSLAKIGVILVSCSCGKWSPIDADVPNRFRPQPLANQNVVLLGLNGLVLHIFVLAWISLYQVGASSANSNPGAGELTGRISGKSIT